MTHPNVVFTQNEISSEFPDFKVRRKSERTLMKVINVILLVLTFGQQRSFMTGFTTTLGNTVYTSSKWDSFSPIAQILILRHERVHMRQARKHGRFLFSFLYLFCWLPVWRAHWRTKFEQEAYEESMRALLEYGEDPRNIVFRARTIKHFTSAEYFWMWTNEKDVAAWFDAATSRIMGAKKN
jgi:hypothetical protein